MPHYRAGFDGRSSVSQKTVSPGFSGLASIRTKADQRGGKITVENRDPIYRLHDGRRVASAARGIKTPISLLLVKK